MKFVLASNNQKKLKEMRAILSELGYEVLSQSEAGLHFEVEETGVTFAENAMLKANAAVKALGMPAIADDSGLEVEALFGAPGVYSARYGGEGLTDEDRLALLLKNMKQTEHRKAKFVSSIACIFPNGDIILSKGECYGEILREPKGEGGFGYDPVFYMPECGMTMAELSAEEKNKVSHRGIALRQFKTKLEKYVNEGNK